MKSFGKLALALAFVGLVGPAAVAQAHDGGYRTRPSYSRWSDDDDGWRHRRYRDHRYDDWRYRRPYGSSFTWGYLGRPYGPPTFRSDCPPRGRAWGYRSGSRHRW